MFMKDYKNLKIAYIGGGSKLWARVFMNDLALEKDLCGTVALYDIDKTAAILNAKVALKINESSACVSKWTYTVEDTIETALLGADFVVISILPGTFEEMKSDVHAPEAYGIYQSVGDTAGPGGVFRAMRTVPIYEGFAKKIKEICPSAWVINFTNPMTLCVKTLFDVFPDIKAFGCCHEVFHTQEFLCCVLKEMLDIPRPKRKEIFCDVSGVNHFTWITRAFYKDRDILSLLPLFIEKYFNSGYYEYGKADQYKTDCFAYSNKVKMDLYVRYGALAAAGDRHLVEFLNPNWYIKTPQMVADWGYALTSVDYRIQQQQQKIQETHDIAEGKEQIQVKKSTEEAVDLIKAILGLGDIVSNVNMPNIGQLPFAPLQAVTETNCVFSHNSVQPVVASPLPLSVRTLVLDNLMNQETLYQGIKHRDVKTIFASFLNQPLCIGLTVAGAKDLFCQMQQNTKKYLPKELQGYV